MGHNLFAVAFVNISSTVLPWQHFCRINLVKKMSLNPFPVDPGVTNRPIRFKLTVRTDDPDILKTILQIHWSSPIVNKRSFWPSANAGIADRTVVFML